MAASASGRQDPWPATWTGETDALRKIAATANILHDVPFASDESEQSKGAVSPAIAFRSSTTTTSVSESSASNGSIGAAVAALEDGFTATLTPAAPEPHDETILGYRSQTDHRQRPGRCGRESRNS